MVNLMEFCFLCMYTLCCMSFQAIAGILEFCRSLLRQSNPSTLTAAGFSPNFILTQPPLRADADGDDKPDGEEIVGGGIIGMSFSSLNRAS